MAPEILIFFIIAIQAKKAGAAAKNAIAKILFHFIHESLAVVCYGEEIVVIRLLIPALALYHLSLCKIWVIF